MIVAQLDERMLSEVTRRLNGVHKKTPQVLSEAMNRAITNINSNIKKEVRKDYHIKAKDIQATLQVKKASKIDLSGSVRSLGSPIPLDKFNVSPKTANPRRKTQLKIAVKKDGIKTIAGAFIADINGKKVFKRTAKNRLPIDKLFGPSIPQMIDHPERVQMIQEEGNQVFLNRLDHNINRILNSGATI